MYVSCYIVCTQCFYTMFLHRCSLILSLYVHLLQYTHNHYVHIHITVVIPTNLFEDALGESLLAIPHHAIDELPATLSTSRENCPQTIISSTMCIIIILPSLYLHTTCSISFLQRGNCSQAYQFAPPRLYSGSHLISYLLVEYPTHCDTKLKSQTIPYASLYIFASFMIHSG